MRIGPNDKFWLVTDPTPTSQPNDHVTQASLKNLDLMFNGGLSMTENPTLFTDKQEAEIEAYGRYVAMRAKRVIAEHAAAGNSLSNVDRIEIRDAKGAVVFTAPLG